MNNFITQKYKQSTNQPQRNPNCSSTNPLNLMPHATTLKCSIACCSPKSMKINVFITDGCSCHFGVVKSKLTSSIIFFIFGRALKALKNLQQKITHFSSLPIMKHTTNIMLIQNLQTTYLTRVFSLSLSLYLLSQNVGNFAVFWDRIASC